MTNKKTFEEAVVEALADLNEKADEHDKKIDDVRDLLEGRSFPDSDPEDS